MTGTELYPAIDLRDGAVVRLLQGDYDRQTTYGDDPVAVAVSFAEQGATWIHVVDLDAARSGSPRNRGVVAAIAKAVAGQARVQTGGGVRTADDAEALALAGVARVVMGSAAVRSPELVADASAVVPVAVGLDHRKGELAVHGWTEGSGVMLFDALGWFPSAAAFVITDIGRDGMLEGPDLDGLAAAAAATSVPVIASGGVATLDDVERLGRVPGIAGVITGKALY
jgi:phosphoribosylformimino-5-aminoimidazole carboxamide ribotide isomerase